MKYLLAFLLLCNVTFGQIAPALLDGEVNALAIVNDAERRIHQGKMWHFSEFDTLATTEVKQKTTVIPTNVEVDDIFTIIIGPSSVSFTATGATVQNVVEGLQNLADLNADDAFSDLVFTEDNSEVLVVADTAGRGFLVTTTAVDGGGADTQTLDVVTSGAGNSVVNVPDKLEYLITTTSDKSAHILFDVTGQVITTVAFYRDCTRTGGIAKTAYNKDGSSTETQTVTLTAYPAGSGDGTAIFVDKWGISAGTGATTILGGGATRDSNEWIIEKSGAYLLVVEGITDADDVSVHINWYEIE